VSLAGHNHPEQSSFPHPFSGLCSIVTLPIPAALALQPPNIDFPQMPDFRFVFLPVCKILVSGDNCKRGIGLFPYANPQTVPGAMESGAMDTNLSSRLNSPAWSEFL